MSKFGQDAGVTPLFFFRRTSWDFINDHRESGPVTSHPKEGAIGQYSVSITIWGWAL